MVFLVPGTANSLATLSLHIAISVSIQRITTNLGPSPIRMPPDDD